MVLLYFFKQDMGGMLKYYINMDRLVKLFLSSGKSLLGPCFEPF